MASPSPGQVAMSGLKAQVAVGDGTVTVPSIGFSNDTNTGIYRPGSDAVGVVTGGIERMRVDASGNVGIGTNTANEALSVFGAIRAGSSTSTAVYHTNKEVKWRGDGQAHYSIFNENSVFSIRNTSENSQVGTTGTTLIAINSAGNVGIGSGNPASKLDIVGDIRLTGVFIQPNKPILRVNFLINTNGDLNSTGVIKWNNIEIDTRSGYSTSTGLYTIPVTGYYHFYCHAYRTSADTDSEIGFIINGNTSAQTTGTAYSRANTPSTTGFIPLVLLTDIYLAQGNTIGVNIAIPSVHYNSQGISYFGGHMI